MLLILGVNTAGGSVWIPMSLRELAEASVAVVSGHVDRVESFTRAEGTIATKVLITDLSVLRGPDLGSTIELQEDGGSVGSVTEQVSGVPHFAPGERVVLFLAERRDGTLHTHHGQLGKLRIIEAKNGRRLQRLFSDDLTFLLPPGSSPPATSLGWQELAEAIDPAEAIDQDPGHSSPRGSAAVAPSFRITQAGRFFEPDDGSPVDFRLDFRGDSALGFVASQEAVEAAMAAWSDVEDATVTLRIVGLTNDLGRVCPGPNKVIFDDPEGIISPPIINPDGNDPGACRGELARGIQRTTRFESKGFNGIELERVSCGFLVLADGWGDCDVWTPCNVAEIATHELGHILGLGHSSEDLEEPEAVLRDATMYLRAHFDGRCAGLMQDDVDGVRFLYPAALPPTITTVSPLPNGLPGVLYTQDLSAIGGAGDFTWNLVGGGFAGLSLSANGVLSGIPEVHGSSFFQVRATDTDGGHHVKVLSFTAGTPGPVAPTATRTPSTSPTASVTPTATPTPTPSAEPTTTPTSATSCAGDCDGSGNVTVDEIVVLVGIALGSAEECPAGDRDGSGSITVDEILQAVNAALLGGC